MRARSGAKDAWAQFALDLGMAFRRRRSDRGLTQERVAELADISLYAYQQYERGYGTDGRATNPRLATVLSICQVLDTEVQEILPEVPQLARTK